jgi:Flp pilus assembly protein TadG
MKAAGLKGTMIKLLKKLMRDRRGNALILAGLSLPLVIGSAGLATDTIQWVLWKRQLQRAADSAALAGVYAEAQSAAVDTSCSSYSGSSYSSPVSWDVRKNNRVWPTTTCVVHNPPTSGTYTGDTKAVQVALSVQQSLPFSQFFVSTAPTIAATATATLQDTGKFCMVALNNTSSPGITIGGSASASLGCGAISNSTAASNSVDPNGASYNFAAAPVASVGGMPSSINGASNLQPNHIAEPDPFLNKYPTSVPAGVNCTSFQSHSSGGNGNGNGNGNVTTLSPGCYNGFNPSGGGNYSMQAGVYYLNNTDFSPGGGVTISGTGVTIILTGTNPGSLQLDGNETLQLVAPTSGTYSKMLFIQASNATTNNLNKLNGTSTSTFDGGMYFPKGEVQFNGTTGAMTKCAMVVAWTIDISGNANLQNNTTGCYADQTVTAKVVRLVE